MKKLVTIFGVVLASTLLSAALPYDNQVLAVSGCCKERLSTSHSWRNTGKTIEQCKSLNEAEGDNVFDEDGRYWWDVSC